MKALGSTGGDITRHLLQISRTKLLEDFLPRLEQALSMLDEEHLWVKEGEATNSVGNILLHMEGNLRQWIIVAIGRGADKRDRPAEFSARETHTRAELSALLHATVLEACSTLALATAEDLARPRRIQVYDVTGYEAVYHAVEHFSYHLGQVIHIVKQRTGRDLRFYAF